jgi:hypothetical protein
MRVIVQIPFSGCEFIYQDYLSCPCKGDAIMISVSRYFTYLRVVEILHTSQGPILYTSPLRKTVEPWVLEACQIATLGRNVIRAPSVPDFR